MVERIGNEEGIEFGANVEAAEPILVAQANTGTAEQPAPAPTATETRVVVELEDGVILRLPATASVDQPRENGTDLEFVQPDGSVIVVPNGAIQGLTIFIGTAEIPPLTVAALFESNGIEAAAGPAGAGAGARGSGGNFEVPVGGIGDAFALGDLLDPTELAFGANPLEDIYPSNTAPRFAFDLNEVRLSEEGLSAGLADGFGNSDTTNASVYAGNLGATDVDGDPLTFRFGQPPAGLTSHGAEITWIGVGSSLLTGWANGQLVVSATVTGSTGSFTVTLHGPIDHPDTTSEDQLSLDIPVTATDGRGGSASTIIRLIVEDDSPVVNLTTKEGGQQALTMEVDETAGTNEDRRNGAGDAEDAGGNANTDHLEGTLGQVTTKIAGGLDALFNLTGGYGADGPGTVTGTLSFIGFPAEGGLATSLSTKEGQITLFLEDGVIVGRVGGTTVLTIEIVGTPGEQQLQTTLYQAINHGNDGNAFDSEAILKLIGEGESATKIQLQYSVNATDYDGDSAGASATIDLITNSGSAISFDDDGPKVLVTEPVVRHVYENDIKTAWSQGTSPNDGNNEGGPGNGSYTHSNGAAYITGTLANAVDFGSDGAAAGGGFSFTANWQTYLEGLNLFSKQTALPENGLELVYSKVGNTIYAYEPDTQGWGDTSNPVFTLTLNADGSYEFRLYDELIHKAGDGENTELRSGSEGTIDGINFGAIIKATDGDGDSITLDGKFTIKIVDDVPQASLTLRNGSVQIDESGVNDSSSDDNTSSSSVKNQFKALEQSGQVGDDPHVSGDNNGSTFGNGAIAYARSSSALVSSDVTIGADSPALTETLSLGLFSSGNASVSSLSSGLFTTGGNSIVLEMWNGLIVGRVQGGGSDPEGKIAFALAIDSDGRVSVAQYLSLKHSQTNDSDEGVSLDLSHVIGGTVRAILTVTDSDGDTATSSVSIGNKITFEDDGPSVWGNDKVVLEDDDLPGGIEGGIGDDSAPQNAKGTLSHDYGADGAGSTLLSSVQTPSGFTSVLSQDKLTLTIYQGNVAVLKVALTNTTSGDYTVTQLAPINHPNGQNENNVDFTVKYTVKDGDGDSATGELKITVDDDSPIVSVTAPQNAPDSLTLNLDETVQANGPRDANFDRGNVSEATDSNGGRDDVDPAGAPDNVWNRTPVASTAPSASQAIGSLSTTAGQINGLFTVSAQYGADGAGSISHKLSFDLSDNTVWTTMKVTALSGTNIANDSDGERTIYLVQVSDTVIEGRISGSSSGSSDNYVAFRLTLTNATDPANAKIVVDQFLPIDHGGTETPSVFDEQIKLLLADRYESLKLKLETTITDKDGDKATGSAEVTLISKDKSFIAFDDDGPTVGTNATVVVDDEDLTGGIAGGDGDAYAPQNATGTLAHDYGTDGKGSVTLTGFTLPQTGGFTALVSNGGLTLTVYQNNQAVLKIVLTDSTSGQYTVTQLKPISHPTGLAENDVDFTIKYEVKDGDGDKVTGTLAITVDDDTPVAKIVGTEAAVIVDETSGVDAGSNDTGTVPSWANALGTVLQAAVSASAVVSTAGSAYGADGAGTTVLGLSLTSQGVDSGLDATQGGNIYLFKEGDIVVGRINGAGGDPAFAISIGADGKLTVVQFKAIKHDNPNDHDESGNGAEQMANVLSATITVTDKDGDVATESVAIGNKIKFEDDGPSVTLTAKDVTLAVDESVGTGGSTQNEPGKAVNNDETGSAANDIGYARIAASNLFTIDANAGVDGEKSRVFALELESSNSGLVDTASGKDVKLEWDGSAIVGKADGQVVFRVSVESDGSVSVNQYRAIKHADTSSHDEGKSLGADKINLVVTLTDGDNDSAKSSIDLGKLISFEDDGPAVNATQTVRNIYENDVNTNWSQGTSPSDGNNEGGQGQGSNTDWDGAAYITGSLTNLVDFGSDGAAAGGGFSFTSGALAYLTGLNLFSKETALPENGLALVYTMSGNTIYAYEPDTAGFGDTSNPVFTLTLSGNGNYEFRLYDELIHKAGDGANTELRSGSSVVDGINFGAIIKATDGDGDSVTLDGKFVIKVVDDVPQAELSLRNGSVQIDESGISDSSSDNNTTSSSVRDQFKSLELTGQTGDDLDVSGTGAIAYARSSSAVVSSDVEIGADSPALSQSLGLGLFNNGGQAVSSLGSGLFTTGGNAITLEVVGNLIVGRVQAGGSDPANKIAFAIAIDADGRVSVAQYLSLKHPQSHDSDEGITLDLSNVVGGTIRAVLSVTDSDGDVATDSVSIGNKITFDDDGPSVGSNKTVALDDDDLTNGIPNGPNDDAAPKNAKGTLSHDYGADGAGSTLLSGVTLPNGLNLTSELVPGGLTLLIKQGGVTVVTITLDDATSGAYTVTQNKPIQHSNGNDENNVDFTVKYVVKDGDGDTANGELKVSIDDDSPVVDVSSVQSNLSSLTLNLDETVQADGPRNVNADRANGNEAADSNGGRDDVDPAGAPADAWNRTPVTSTNPTASQAIGSLSTTAGQINGLFTVSAQYGADGAGTTTHKLSFDLSDDTVWTTMKVTALVDTNMEGDSDGQRTIYLVQVSDTVIEGRISGSSNGNSDNYVAFRLTLTNATDPANAKIVVDQFLPIDHGADTPSKFDEQLDLFLTGNASLKLTLETTITDKDGDKDTASTDVTLLSKDKSFISFDDDGPQANVASASQVDEGTTLNGTWSVDGGLDGLVETKFTFGNSTKAFGSGQTISFTTNDGTLTVSKNGTWSFQASQVTADKALSFSVSAKDGDGDVVTKTQNFTVKNVYIAPTGGDSENASFNEANLSDGSNPNPGALTQSTYLTFTAGSNALTNFKFAADTSTLTQDGDSNSAAGQITWTLNGARTQLIGSVAGQAVITLTIVGAPSIATGATGTVQVSIALSNEFDNYFGDDLATVLALAPIKVEGSDGVTTVSGTVSVSVTDDVPTATNDNVGQIAEDAPFTTNVLGNDKAGADGIVLHSATLTTVGAGVVTGFTANGDVTFDPAPGFAGEVKISYVIVDGDGDESTATLTLVVNPDSIPAISVTDGTVYEAGLPGGSDASANSETTSGTFSINTFGDTLSKLEVNGQDVTGGGTVYGEHGTLVVTLSAGTYSWTYTLTETTTGDGTKDEFAVLVTDSDGSAKGDTLTVSIVDDQPLAKNDTDYVSEDGTIADGNVLTGSGGSDLNTSDGTADTQGADGVNSVSWTGATNGVINDAYGTLTVGANGSYSFALNSSKADVQALVPGETIERTFTYKITDADADESTATLKIVIEGADDGVTLTNLNVAGGELTVYENDLPLGSDTIKESLTASGTFTISAPDGLSGLTIGTTAFITGGVFTAGSFQTAQGNTFTVVSYNATTGVLSYSYTLGDREQHANVQGENLLEETFAVQATDRNGSAGDGVINVNIVDDVPTANSGAAFSVLETAAETNGVNLLANDVKGADGATVTAISFDGGNTWSTVNANGTTTIEISGVGTFKFDAAGNWSLDPDVNASLSDIQKNFTYQITDGDGDTSTATQQVTVQNANSIPTAGLAYATVDDDGLPGGNAAGTGDATAGSPETVATGTLPHDFLADGAASSDPISFASMTSGTVGTEAVTYSWDAGSNTLTASSAARTAIFTVQVDNGIDNGNGAFKVTLLKPIMHAAGGDENDAVVDLTYTVKDSNNDTATGTLQITFDDDTPVATAQSVTIAEGTEAKSNVVLVLDRSTSMNEDGDPATQGTQQRIDLMKAAIANLFASGNVNAVFIVSFAGSGTFHNSGSNGGWYTDLTSALAAVNALTLANYTDYDAALATVQNNYVAPPAGGNQTVLMFLSDGEPTDNNGTGSDGIIESDTNGGSVGEETAWINFMSSKGIDAAYAFGFGGLGNSDVGYLEPIAWTKGEKASTYDATDTSPSASDYDDAADDPNVVVITNVAQLGGYLEGTIAASAQGNILTNGTTPASFGADGGRIYSVVINGVTYTWNGTNLIDPSNSGTDIVGTTLTNIATANGGKFSFNFVTGAWSYTAPASITADITDQFQYTLRDNDGDTSSSSVSVTVENANEAPNTTAATASGQEDAASIAVALQGSDADGTVSSYVIKSLPANGLLYADPAKTVLLAVGSTVTASGGQATVYFAPAADYSGQATFQFAAKDDDGAEDASPATATITVTAVNDAPVITSNGGGDAAAISVAENTTAVTTVTSTDVDSTTRTYSIAGGVDAAKFTINATTGVLSFVSAPNFESPTDVGGNNVYDVIVRVSDGTATDTQSIAVTVTNANESPVISSPNSGNAATINVNENSTAVTTIVAADPDAGTTLTYTLSGSDAGKFQISPTGVLTFVTAPNYEAPTDNGTNNVYNVTVTVSDGTLTDTQSLTINVQNVNEAPVITSNGGGDTAAINVAENSTAVTTVTSTDPDSGATKTFSIVGGADAAKFSINSSGVLTFISAPNYEAPTDAGGNNVYDVIVRVSDGSLTDTQSIAVTVTNVAEAASAGDDRIVTNAGTNSAFVVPEWALLANDTGDGTLDVTASTSNNSNNNGITTSLITNPGSVTVTDTNNPGGSFTYTVSNGSSTDTGSVTVVQSGSNTINGNSGSDIVIAKTAVATAQSTRIDFVSTYDVGDRVSIVVNGTTYTHTVVSGGTGREAVYDALKAVNVGGVTLAASLAAQGVTWASNLSNGSVTLTGLPGVSFAIETAIENVRTYSIDFTDNVYNFDGSWENVSITIGGLTYTQIGDPSGNSNQGFDSYAQIVAGMLPYNATYNSGTNTISFSTADILSISGSSSGTTTQNGSTPANATVTFTTGTTHSAPSVSTTEATTGGSTLNGNGGNDVLIGSAGNDILTGGDGDDILFGGLGNDTLTGGTGADTFRFAETGSDNADTITDFVVGQDTIDLSDLLNATDIDASNIGSFVRVQDTGANALLQVNTDGSGNDWVDVATLNGHGNVGTVIDLKIDNEDHSVLVTQQII